MSNSLTKMLYHKQTSMVKVGMECQSTYTGPSDWQFRARQGRVGVALQENQICRRIGQVPRHSFLKRASPTKASEAPASRARETRGRSSAITPSRLGGRQSISSPVVHIKLQQAHNSDASDKLHSDDSDTRQRTLGTHTPPQHIKKHMDDWACP